mmetsp:Transcript_59000/g.173191  ORF Transcript_59000/g.173191 Transcript_59000/m.173191 type:complete len:208 (-) Transcript_59000:732-1355(-)
MPAALALLHGLLPEVRDLQELGALDVERLDKAASEVEHRVGRGEPLAHAGDLDHGLRDLHRVAQDGVEVGPELLRHEAVAPLHMRPDEELVLHDGREREAALLVLHDVARELLYLLVVRRPRRHDPALGAGGQELGAGLRARELRDVLAQEVQRLDQHPVGREVLGPLVVADEGERHRDDEDPEEADEDVHVVFLLQEEARQPDADL